MADGDERYIPIIETTEEGIVKSPSVNEAFRQVFQILHYLEGRVGPVTVRDDLEILGSVTLTVGSTTPDPSDDGTATIYMHPDDGLQVNQNGGPDSELIGSTNLRWSQAPRVVVNELNFTDAFGVDISEGNGQGSISLPELDYSYSVVTFLDDFFNFDSTNYTIGRGWYTPAIARITEDSGAIAGHPGVIRLATGAVVNTVAHMRWNRISSTSMVLFDDTFKEFSWAMAPTSSTNQAFLLGMGSSPNDTSLDADLGPESIAFKFDSSVSPNWFCQTVTGGVATNTNSGIPLDPDDWMTLRAVKTETGVDFYINGAVTHQTTNIPLNSQLQAACRIENLTGANKELRIDNFGMRLIGLPR